MSVIYLFTRYRFNWSEVEFSFFSTYGMITNLFGKTYNTLHPSFYKICIYFFSGVSGTLFSVGIFSHLLKIDDALIGVMSCVSKILSSFVYAFAVTNWQLFLGRLLKNCTENFCNNWYFVRSDCGNSEWYVIYCDAIDSIKAGVKR
jgi:MFS transporter, PCFT/HCP family, solute carrier family 46, member 3